MERIGGTVASELRRLAAERGIEIVPPAGQVGSEGEEVWLAAGLRKPYRICSWERDYGEFDELEAAREFMRLLLLGNPHLKPAYESVPYDWAKAGS